MSKSNWEDDLINALQTFINVVELEKEREVRKKFLINLSAKTAWTPRTDFSDGSLRDSKYFGKPYLFKDESLPRCSNCRKPMRLLFQLNFDTLPEKARRLFGSGLLQLFHCARETNCETNPSLVQEFGRGKLVRLIQPQADGQDYELPFYEERYKSMLISDWEEIVDMPRWSELRDHLTKVGLFELEKVYDFDEYSNNFPVRKDKLFGYPFYIQNKTLPKCPICKVEMTQFFQLNLDNWLPVEFGSSWGVIFQCSNHRNVVEFISQVIRRFYILEPEVAGNIFGQKSVVDVSVHPPQVIQLDYQFDGWSGDDLLQSFPCYIATKRLKDALLEISPTGVEFAEMTTSKSEQFEEMYPNRQLPTFFWLKVNGQAGVDDFALFDKARTILAGKITRGTKLVVSERVLDVMESLQIDNCEIDVLSASLQEVI